MATGSFIWGNGGARLTPEEVAMMRRQENALLARGVDTSPVGHWTQGAARVADAIAGAFRRGDLEESAALNAQDAAAGRSTLARLLGGGATPSVSPVASALTSGVNQELNATSPAPVVAEGEIADYIRQAATARGIDPEIAVRVAMSEGGVKDPIRQSNVVKNGVREASYGPFQLYMGGGLGNKALEAGIDPRDPNQWRQGVDFALDQAATGGWGPWYGAAKVGVGNRTGLDNARAIGFNRQSASPAAAAIEQAAPASGYVDPVVSAPNSAASSLAPLPAPVNVASAPRVASMPSAPVQNVAPTNSLGVNPEVVDLLMNPYIDEPTRNVAQLLLQQQQGTAAEARKQALAEQQRQQEIARRQQIADKTGINPAYAADDELWKGATGDLFAAPSTSTVNGQVVDNRTGSVLYSAPQQPTTGMQDYQSYANYETQNGRTPLGPLEYEQALRRSGATNIDTGTIPTGYQAVRDAEGRLTRYDPVPGGPADTTKKEGLAKTNTERSGNIVLEDVDRAVSAIESNPALTTGIIGNWSRGISGTPANKVQNLLQTIRANSAFDRLQQMREASPTGGALGAVSDSELGLLQNAIGSLEQSNDSEDLTYNLRRVQGIYEDIIYGKDEAKRLREERRKTTSENPLPPQPNGKKTSTGVQWSID